MNTDKITVEDVFENLKDLHTLFTSHMKLVPYPHINITTKEKKKGTSVTIVVKRNLKQTNGMVSFNGRSILNGLDLNAPVTDNVTLGEVFLAGESILIGRSIILKEYFIWVTKELERKRDNVTELETLEGDLMKTYGGEIIGEALKE